MSESHSLSLEVGKTTRAFGLLALIALSMECGVIAWRITNKVDVAVFADKTRVLLWIIGILPSWALTISLGLTAAKTRRSPPLGASIVTATAMLLPVLIAVFFHDVPREWDTLRNWLGSAIGIGLAAVVFRLLFSGKSKVPEKGPISEIATLAADILWYDWIDDPSIDKRRTVILAPHRTQDGGRVSVDQKEIAARLSFDAYSEAQSLRQFQSRFSGVQLDGRRIAEVVVRHCRQIGQADEIRILDIGGANGELTANFLNALRETSQTSRLTVHCIEASGFRQEYRSRVSSFASEVRVIEGVFPAASLNLTRNSYDIILASHSLYSVLDDTTRSEREIPSHLRRLLKPSGLAIVILSSNRSRYFHLRVRLRARLFPAEMLAQDSCAESLALLLEHVGPSRLVRYDTSRVIDNVIDLGGLDIEGSGEVELRAWLSYVLRKHPREFDSHALSEARLVLADWGIDGGQLPESFLAEARNGGVEISDFRSAVLHKALLCTISIDHTEAA
jgi:hypothetical protein